MERVQLAVRTRSFRVGAGLALFAVLLSAGLLRSSQENVPAAAAVRAAIDASKAALPGGYRAVVRTEGASFSVESNGRGAWRARNSATDVTVEGNGAWAALAEDVSEELRKLRGLTATHAKVDVTQYIEAGEALKVMLDDITALVAVGEATRAKEGALVVRTEYVKLPSERRDAMGVDTESSVTLVFITDKKGRISSVTLTDADPKKSSTMLDVVWQPIAVIVPTAVVDAKVLTEDTELQRRVTERREVQRLAQLLVVKSQQVLGLDRAKLLSIQVELTTGVTRTGTPTGVRFATSTAASCVDVKEAAAVVRAC